MTQPPSRPAEPTPVDDVRRVRERLDREAQGNLYALAEQSREAVERFRGPLDLKLISRPVKNAAPEAKTA